MTSLRRMKLPGRGGSRPSFLPLAALLLSLSSALQISCAPARPLILSFPWKAGSGDGLDFRDSAQRRPGEEGLFSRASPRDRYTLDRAHLIAPGEALELELLRRDPGGAGAAATAAGEPRLRMRLAGGRGKAALSLEEELTLHVERTYFVIPLPQGQSLGSVEVELLPGSSSAGEVVVRGLAFRPLLRGFQRLPDGVRISAGFSLYVEGGKQKLLIERPFEGLVDASEQAEGPALILEYGPSPLTPPFELAPTATKTGRLRLSPRAAGLETALGAALFPVASPSLELSLPSGVEIRSFYTARAAAPLEELADLGRVLESPPRSAAADFDLYRWDRFPSVLVLDFKDYAAQDRYLKRLAFFTEKSGFRGRLAPNAEIAELHGWNAHDYRAEDLAAFFEKARASAFPLNPEEVELGKLLEERGILVRQEGRILPGAGAFVSISRESPAYLRVQLLVHESTHAIFFLDADYRNFVRSLWASLGDEERWYWKLYFNWSGYDTGSDYLMANEFQAYLLQQPLARAEDYFTKTWTAQILQKHPEYKPRIETYLERFSKTYAQHAAALDAWLEKNYGLGAGRTFTLY